MDSDTVKLLRDAGKIIKAHCKVTHCYECPFYVTTGYYILGRAEMNCQFKSIYKEDEYPCNWRVE